MKLALLACDHVAAPFIETHGTYPMMFRRLLNMDLDVFDVVGGQFPEVQDYDAYLTTGSKYSVYEPLPWIDELKDFTREAFQIGKKFVGDCFGHQLIGEALGGKVAKADSGYLIGVHSFDVLNQRSWMVPGAENYHILMLCQDQIVQLPNDAVVLATSEECPYGMITIEDHFLGIQGHPEFTKAYNEAVFLSRIDRIGEEKVTKARLSLRQNIDIQLLSGWITHFLWSK